MHHSLVGERRSVANEVLWDASVLTDQQDMRMKFDAEDPSEVSKSGSEGVNRSQGAARAISVSPQSVMSA